MNLKEFNAALKGLMKDDDRPFVCKGSPLNCKVFIVGCNPATGNLNFNDYLDESGFDYNSWFEKYKQDRLSNNKPEISPTRRNINIITQVLEEAKINVLETNVYSKPTESKMLLSSDDQNTTIFNFLLETIKPNILFIHGNDARKAIENTIKSPLNHNQLNKIGDREIFCVLDRHLSYQFSKEDARNVGSQLVEIYNKNFEHS